ncbi:hypothetical protein VTK56DRAFT_3600 [Thermocarpiscus australiensis]
MPSSGVALGDHSSGNRTFPGFCWLLYRAVAAERYSPMFVAACYPPSPVHSAPSPVRPKGGRRERRRLGMMMVSIAVLPDSVLTSRGDH